MCKMKILALCYGSWCGLGFIRGTMCYNYKRDVLKINNGPYLYSKSICNGLVGTLFYASPIYWPFALYEETCRLEINIRNLEDEKESCYYNSLIFPYIIS